MLSGLVSHAVDSSKQACQCRISFDVTRKDGASDYPTVEPVPYFQEVKANKTVVKNGIKVTVTHADYQYKRINGATTYWARKKDLKDLKDPTHEGGNRSKGSGEEINRGMFIEIL